MIPGIETREIANFAFYDAEFHTSPEEGQTFVGIPYAYYHEYSKPFIEIYENNKLIGTINIDYVASIRFKEESNNE